MAAIGVLKVWPADYGLPSVQSECLHTLTLVKMFKLKTIKVEEAIFPLWKQYPNLVFDGLEYSSTEAILLKLRSMINVSSEFDDYEMTRQSMYYNYIIDRLGTASLISVWVEDPNFYGVTSKWYTRAIGWPVGSWYGGSMRRHIKEHICALMAGRLTTEYKTLRYQMAFECIKDLNNLLGHQKYFYGSEPSTLDACAYSYLAPILKTPLIENVLQQELVTYPNLVCYVDMITTIHFPETKVEYKFMDDPHDSGDEKLSWKLLLTAGASVAGLMLAYALVNGIISMRWRR